MKSFLGATMVVGLAAATFMACGGSSSDQNAKSPSEPTAMNQLTPEQREEAQKRAGEQHEREQLASSREPGASTGETKTTTALAVASIATARCDRELKCQNVGTNKTYLSTDECVTKMQNDKRTGLNPQECPRGVSDSNLASCLKSIRDEACGNPLDSISRLTTCRTGALCLN
jgi:Family of unknown function (DUF6184)